MGIFTKHKKKYELNRIEITGKAQNADGQAIVVTDANKPFYLWGMQSWTEGWINKKVKIIGDVEYRADGRLLIKDAVAQLLT